MADVSLRELLGDGGLPETEAASVVEDERCPRLVRSASLVL